MAKLGTYGVIRFDLNLFPQASRTLAPVLLTLAVIGILYGAVVACAQRDLKRLLAYSSLAQIGFIALGTFALNSQGAERRRAPDGQPRPGHRHPVHPGRLDLRAAPDLADRSLKGLQSPAPVLAGVFTLAMLASIGVPGLNGFVGEFLILIGTFVAHRWWAGWPPGVVIVAAVYLLWGYQQVFHGEPDRRGHHDPGPVGERAPDRGAADRAHRALGVFPKPVLDRITPSVNQLVVHVDQVTHTAGAGRPARPTAARPDRSHPAPRRWPPPGSTPPASTGRPARPVDRSPAGAP